MVARVAEARAARTAAVDAELEALGAAAERAAAILCAPVVDTAALGEIFIDAHARLSLLGVSAPVLDAMVAAAGGAGASGAKLTGGGGGGAVIALAPGREDAVLGAWRAMGKHGFVTQVGGRS
jgi:mevalonate kinase